ncbi:MAG TPA: hypothetical protein VL332_05950, partial [Candidatus Saccharimonadaceae bacterium]|nr:hypothetical protein [Candidatus Saccharimonadaceae bacterium]
MPPRKGALRSLPAVEVLLGMEPLAAAARDVPRALVLEAARAEIAEERARLRKRAGAPADAPALAARAAARARAEARPSLRRVLN